MGKIILEGVNQEELQGKRFVLRLARNYIQTGREGKVGRKVSKTVGLD